MRRIVNVSLFVLLSMTTSHASVFAQTDVPPKAWWETGPYLGQTPPGDLPELFAPGIVSTAEGHEMKIAFSPDGCEVFFTRARGRHREIIYTNLNPSGWLWPETAPFSGQYTDEMPHFAPDGNRLFFQSDRPVPDSSGQEIKRGQFKLWYVDHQDTGWSEPVLVNKEANVGVCINHVDTEGAIYFAAQNPWQIVRSEFIDGRYAAPVRIEAPFNVEGVGSFAPCFAPDGRFVIFASGGRGGLGKSDLWICFRRGDGSWSEPVNAGKTINTGEVESFPVLSPDGEYLFYTSRGDIYWVDVALVDAIDKER